MTDEPALRTKIGAREYLAAAFEPSDRLAVLVRNRRDGQTVQRIAASGRIAEPAFQEWLRFKNDREGADVYVSMNPLKPEARTRTKQDILSIRHLYVDLDHEGRASLDGIEQSKLVPRPNYILATSPDKFQVIWRVEDFPQDHAEALLRAMAREFGGDPAATDSIRVLRIPGFANRKYDAGFMVTAEQQTDHVYKPPDFQLGLDRLQTQHEGLGRHSARATSVGPRPVSQSEHDWAFAKRALASGADPGDVVRRIAEFREGDKHDVNDYARRTVTKARADLRQRSATRDEDSGTRGGA